MKIKISDYPTFNKEWDKDKTNKKTTKILTRIGELQHKMYAQNKYFLSFSREQMLLGRTDLQKDC